MIRFFDIILSFIGLLLVFPFLLIITIFIVLDSRGGALYRQTRIGKDEIPFTLYKFRTMQSGADKKGLLTVGYDARITKVGAFLRAYKLDELPQLINVLIGDMSLVGPRPEVKKYTDLYTPVQRRLLRVRPGITDPASIYYSDESSTLAQSSNPEYTYIQVVLPHKLHLSASYALNPTLSAYFKYIFLTIAKIFVKIWQTVAGRYFTI